MKLDLRAVVVLTFLLGGSLAASGQTSREEMTPVFCQRDASAGFANDGSEYCAPTSVSSALIYLSRACPAPDLVTGSDHGAQVALIKQLAGFMRTDPKEGTSPDQILTGLRYYVASKNYRFTRLEVATWRPLGSDNGRCKVGTQPELARIREAVTDPKCAVLFHVGWYRKEADGYSRHSGHWMNVAGLGSTDNDFLVHNSWLKLDNQRHDMSVSLTPVGSEFQVVLPQAPKKNMAGYYKVAGPGLPYSKKIAAALLDSVVMFKVQR